MIRLNDIIEDVNKYLHLSDKDVEMIKKAYVYSAKVHSGQKRSSGEPYLSHPLEVSGILAQMKLDVSSIITGLLHDTVEDTLATSEEIESMFGKEIAFLVEGVTKIGQLPYSSKIERQAEGDPVADDDLLVDDSWLPPDAANAEDGDLRVVDDRRERVDPVGAQAADGERAALHVARRQLALAGPFDQLAGAGGQLPQAEVRHVANHRHHQAGIGVHGDANVEPLPR